MVTFGASGTDKCDVEVFFRNQKVKPEKSDDLPFRGRQRRQGSAIIEYLQLDLVHMPKRLGDKAKFTVTTTKTGEYAFEDAAQHRKVFEVDGVKFAITAKPDGILEYEGGKLLFEYKTKASGIKSMLSKLDYKGPDSGHIRQVTAESLVFGIREGIILYESTQKPSWFDDSENKSVTKGQKTWQGGYPIPDVRAFYFYITDEMQTQLLADLAKQAKIVYDGVKPDVTVDCVNKCAFCVYKEHCKSVITPENLAELIRIEEGYARSNFAGKAEHRNLQAYLSEVNA
ncbi:hypothetical protein [Aneurinibacillus aneurinilyticus]|uniref:hypothetical protein n=1 Tax=Aneurinibacillus aneurinilyticus TaxID=1391 RepID=UPI0023F028D7|nr:hypothetical protein [Aneurinibacillus aneurinilyticus]